MPRMFVQGDRGPTAAGFDGAFSAVRRSCYGLAGMVRRADTPATRMLAGLVALLAAALCVSACTNSILRNAAEAGIETALDRPLPTATPARAGTAGANFR